MSVKTKILDILTVTHDVKCFRLEKPEGYKFVPGQATDVSINKIGWENLLRPFTFTALTTAAYLEFTIKRYSDHDGVTNQLHQLNIGDELLLGEAWGAITYNGPGYFIAGGAGITPFIAILRDLAIRNELSGNSIFLSNKTVEDIIYREELLAMKGLETKFILTREKRNGYESGRLDREFIKSHILDRGKQVYVCGPDKMVTDITELVQEIGVSAASVVFEK